MGAEEGRRMKRNRFDEIITALLLLLGVMAVLIAWWLLMAAIGGT